MGAGSEQGTVPVEHLGLVDSTMAEARRRVADGAHGPVWLVAEAQTGGRGRSGRAWVSEPGNLYATLLMPTLDAPMTKALRSFSAALAVADAVDGVTEDPTRVALKWPNDVLLDGRKVAGILLEAGEGWLAIGIGINVAIAPEQSRWPAIALAQAVDEAPASAAVADHLVRRFAVWEARFVGEGFGAIRGAWLARAARLGETIEARLPQETRRGRFDGIAEDGALLLTDDGATSRIAAADVHF